MLNIDQTSQSSPRPKNIDQLGNAALTCSFCSSVNSLSGKSTEKLTIKSPFSPGLFVIGIPSPDNTCVVTLLTGTLFLNLFMRSFSSSMQISWVNPHSASANDTFTS
mmetsp:Transcript_10394/g.18704  ORF Transcript_10394/g.18704 Transcript_10394/m.18704 type:complete len:107 (-) Transcript_10394:1186-1506(-)